MGTLRVDVVSGNALSPDTNDELQKMCRAAYERDVAPIFATLCDPTHVLGYEVDKLVSHALWITRWLQVGEGRSLRTAYVELVATDPAYQRRGFASEVLRRLETEIHNFELGALCPATEEFYSKLGWVKWRGPLFIRREEELLPTLDETVMVLPLAQSPQLNLDEPLSAEWREGELW